MCIVQLDRIDNKLWANEGRDLSSTYNKPPLVEVALSILFSPGSMSEAHLSPFWWKKRADYPSVELSNPIPFDMDSFIVGRPVVKPVTFALASNPESRVMMVSSDSSWLCQFQRNRLAINWRKRGEPYPRYSKAKAILESLWGDLVQYISEASLEPIQIVAWEVTYVNIIEKNEGFSGLEWNEILPGLFHSGLQCPGSGQLLARQCNWIWDIEKINARLSVETRTMLDSSSMILSITSRGVTAPERDVWGHLDDGRDLVVDYFDSITSSESRTQWERQV